MLNNKFTILFLIQFMLGYNIFYHTQDYKIASSSYVASYDTLKNIYNFQTLHAIKKIIVLYIQSY